MRAYSQDLRERALRGMERGESKAEIARRLEVSQDWVASVAKRFEETGLRTCLKMGGHLQPKLKHLEKDIRSWIEQQPDLTLEELVERVRREFEVSISVSGLWYQLERWQLPFKKNYQRSRANPL